MGRILIYFSIHLNQCNKPLFKMNIIIKIYVINSLSCLATSTASTMLATSARTSASSATIVRAATVEIAV